MSSIFEHFQTHDPAKVALTDGERTVLYGDLLHEIDTRVDALFGVSCLAIALDNSVSWVLWDLAALKAGIPCVPLPPFFTDTQLYHSLQAAGVTHTLSPEGLRSIGKEGEPPLPTGTAKVTFTSGTTGAPKGVCLSQTAMENVAHSIVEILGEEFVGTHDCVLPLAVLLENVAGVYAALVAGCTVNLGSLHNFGANYENLHAHLKNSHATSAILVPEILRSLMAQIALYGPLPALKFVAVGGSKVDPKLITQARAMGLPVYEGYGLSECASVVSLNTPEHDKRGSVGHVLPHVQTRIEDGEIIIINPGFLGYIGDERSGPFATGDLGTLDNEWFLSVTGRKKNVLITSYGRNVSPEWVEAALLAHPAILQAVVYGDAQPHLSALLVTSASDQTHNAVDAANASLPDYAQIKDFRIVPPFTLENGTLTGTGRPRRDHILNLYIQETTDELLRSTC